MVTEQNSTPDSVESMIDSLEGYVLDRQIGIADICKFKCFFNNSVFFYGSKIYFVLHKFEFRCF